MSNMMELASETDWYKYYRRLGHASYSSHNALGVWIGSIVHLREESPEMFTASFYDAWIVTNFTWPYLFDLIALEQDGDLTSLSRYMPAPPDTSTGTWTVYRGVRDPDHCGMSWTLDRDRAMWFARRSNPHELGYLLTAVVDLIDVMEYTDERKEAEVILWPEACIFIDVETERISQ